ncbi:MAG: translation initiation factor IF-2 [Chloroflexi bacterium]|nr:translation initiation factor IF-2 [Chloroflexota bacterium]
MARRRRTRRRPPPRPRARRRPQQRPGPPTEERPPEPEETPAVELRQVAMPTSAAIAEIAERADVPPTDIIMELLNRGVLATINAAIDRDTARAVMRNLGVAIVAEPEDDRVVSAAPRKPVDVDAADLPDGEPRPPVVTVMGHVDHGKTTLLDAIRNTNVVDSEFGGITQHIGAYQVSVNGHAITFIDTPGHEAFTAMRARGAGVTDIAVIVVAADDGIMPQTVEAIGHARAASVPIIIAVNKIDLETANPSRVLQQLTEHEIVVEDFGGDVVAVPLSALQGEGINDLLEYINLTAELEELRAPVDGPAQGTIIETRLDHSQGPVATVLVQRGILRVGDTLTTGEINGRVRALFDEGGGRLRTARPSTPVQVMGLDAMPDVGDPISVIPRQRKRRRQQGRTPTRGSGDQAMRLSLESLAAQMTAGRLQQINLVVKADTAGSVDAVVKSIDQLGDDRARAMVVFEGVGSVTESDVNLASAAKGLVLAFNTRVDATAAAEAERQNVDVRTYRTIYELIDDVDAALKGSIKPEQVEVVDGRLEIRGEFRTERTRQIVGGMVLSGRVYTGAQVRILRGNEEIGTGHILTVRRFSDEVDEVRQGFDCGLAIETTTKIQLADIVEASHTEERLP